MDICESMVVHGNCCMHVPYVTCGDMVMIHILLIVEAILFLVLAIALAIYAVKYDIPQSASLSAICAMCDACFIYAAWPMLFQWK